MPELAKKVTVDRARQKLFIDGVEFPYFITEEGVQVHDVATKDVIPTVTVTFFADDIEVIPAADRPDPAEVRSVLAAVHRKVLAEAGVEADEATIDRLVTELLPDVEDAFLLAVRKAQTDLKERS